MHVSEGVLSLPVLAGGGLGALALVSVGVRHLDERNVVPTAVVSSALFVATLIRVPIGVSSVHLILSGLAGVLLGWRVFPAFLVALLLQAAVGIGGFSTLGINLLILAPPGLAANVLFRFLVGWRGPSFVFWAGLVAGSSAIAVGGVLLAGVFLLSGEEFTAIAGAVLLAHIPVMVAEGLITGATLRFLASVRPEVLPMVLTSSSGDVEAAT